MGNWQLICARYRAQAPAKWYIAMAVNMTEFVQVSDSKEAIYFKTMHHVWLSC